FKLKEATNGKEAIDCYFDWQPHLIWMDIRMPVMDGIIATQHIREHEKSPVKIIALSASVFEADRSSFISVGCDDFMPKPFPAEDIFELLVKHLKTEFIYQDSVAITAPEVNEVTLSTERLNKLPANWIAKFNTTLIIGDKGAALKQIDLIAAQDPQLAN